jgi:hypothetical protein
MRDILAQKVYADRWLSYSSLYVRFLEELVVYEALDYAGFAGVLVAQEYDFVFAFGAGCRAR